LDCRCTYINYQAIYCVNKENDENAFLCEEKLAVGRAGKNYVFMGKVLGFFQIYCPNKKLKHKIPTQKEHPII